MPSCPPRQRKKGRGGRRKLRFSAQRAGPVADGRAIIRVTCSFPWRKVMHCSRSWGKIRPGAGFPSEARGEHLEICSSHTSCFRGKHVDGFLARRPETSFRGLGGRAGSGAADSGRLYQRRSHGRRHRAGSIKSKNATFAPRLTNISKRSCRFAPCRSRLRHQRRGLQWRIPSNKYQRVNCRLISAFA